MKRALTGIAAASMALGMMAPAAFAATTSSSMQWKTISITAGSSYTASPKGFSGYDHGSTTLTTFAPVYYVEAALKALGYTVSWDGTSLMIQTPNGVQPNLSNISVGTGDVGIYVNGTLVKKVYKQVAGDPASGGKIQTSYIPIYYIDALLQAAGESATWNGSGWALTAPTTSTTSGFSAFTVSGAQQGNGTSASPAISSNGGAIGLTTTLTDSTGVPVSNSAVNISISGSTGATPVVEVNGTYVTATANSSNNGWTATANTDANGKLNVSVVGTGSYTVTLTAANNSSATTSGYVAFLGSNGLLTPNAASGSGYAANISTLSNTSAGVVPVTFTLPLNSSGGVQANTQVAFKVVGGSAFLSTSAGQQVAGNGTTYTVYSNASGQATIYVNDFNAATADGNVEVEAVVGDGSSWTNAAATYIDYSNPSAPSGSYALNNIGAFAFASSAGAASTTSPSSLAGVPVANSVYFAPVDTNGSIYSTGDGNLNYTVNATNGAYIGVSLNTGTASAPVFKTVYLPSSLSSDSSITLQFTQNSTTTSKYDIYANGVQLDNGNMTYSDGSVVGAVYTPDFGVALNDTNASGNSSTVTVKSGSVSASANVVFSGATPAYATNFSPVVSNIGANGSENVTFQVVDSTGAPVKNQQVKLALDSNLASGLWITAVNGTQLTTPNGTGGVNYTPIPLNGSASLSTGALTNTLVPNVATWSAGTASFNAYTDANGDVTLTIQNGGVFAYNGTSNVAQTGTSSDTVVVNTDTANTSASTAAIEFQKGSDTTYTGSGQSATQIAEITNN